MHQAFDAERRYFLETFLKNVLKKFLGRCH